MNEKFAINLSDDGRILSATYERFATSGAILIDELPDGNLADYLYQDGEIVYSPLPDPEQSVEDKIAELKAQLDATDYKIIKCSEAQLAGEDLPYDIIELHTERQSIRDQINTLENDGQS